MKSTLFDIVAKAFDAIPAAGHGLVSTFEDEGMLLMGACATITATYFFIKHVLIGDDLSTFWGNALDLLIKMGIITLILHVAGMNGIPRELFVQQTKIAAQKVLDGNSPEKFIDITMDTLTLIVTGGSKEAEKPLACKLISPSISLNPLDWVLDSRPDECKSPDDFTLLDLLKNLGPVLIAAACGVLAIIATALLSIAFIVVNLKILVEFEIGLGIAPLLIGLSVLPALNHLFSGWINYMLTTALQLLVASFMGKIITNAIVDQIAPAMDSIKRTGGADEYFQSAAIVLVTVAILASIGAYLMWQVPTIASSLLSGGSGASTGQVGRGMIGRVARKFTS